MLSDTQAQLVSQETSVNLIVDGKVVRSATGSNSETLDRASFDMRSYAGQRYMIGWMDNWDYSGPSPRHLGAARRASREMALCTVDDSIRLTSRPVNSVSSLRQPHAVTVRRHLSTSRRPSPSRTPNASV